MLPERCTDQSCKSDCEACRHARLMVTDAIVTSVREVIASLQKHDLPRTKTHMAGLIELLDESPKSTAELIGPEKLAALSRDLNQALLEIAEEALALARLRSVLLVWADDSSGSVH